MRRSLESGKKGCSAHDTCISNSILNENIICTVDDEKFCEKEIVGLAPKTIVESYYSETKSRPERCSLGVENLV